MIPGIGSYALTWAIGVPDWPQPEQPMDAFELVALAASVNSPLVQLADNVPLESLSLAELDRLAKTAATAGIRLETGTRGTEPARMERHLAIAERLGARLVRTLALSPDLDAVHADLAAVLPAYAEKGIAIALENHGLHRAQALADLILGLRAALPDAAACIGCCLDTVNSFGALEGPEPVIAALAPLTLCLHLKEFVIRRHPHQMGFEIIGAPAGSGRLDIPAVIACVRGHAAAQGREMPGIVLEQWVPWQGTIDATVALERSWLSGSLAALACLPDACNV